MNINNAVPIIQNNDDTITLIALPLNLLQQAQQPLLVEQNILLKTLSDGTLVLDTNQFVSENGNTTITTSQEPIYNEKINNAETLIYTIQQKSDVPIEIPPSINKPESSQKDENKQIIRFHSNKTGLDTGKVGRPRKDGTKVKPTDENGPFKCELCEKEFDKYLVLKRHEKFHQNEKKYKCLSCPASFNLVSNHNLHLAIHNTEDPVCPECGKKFQRIASLKAHIAYHEKSENFYCEDCDILFNNEAEMNDHIREHGQDKKAVEADILQCKYCQLCFTNQTEFKKHMNEHNKMRNILQTSTRKKPRKTSTIERKHKCNICFKAFQKQSQIDRHMRVHSGEKPYICKICDRGFSQKGSLQIHMSRHTGIRPHKCALCEAKFSQKGNLRAHILKTHSVPSGGDNVFSCTECSCVFKRLGSLNGHMTRNHPKEKNSDIKFVMSQLVALQSNNITLDNDILQEAILKSDLPEVHNQNQNQNNEKINETPTATYVTLADLTLDGNMRRFIIKQRKVGDIRWHICSFCPKEFKKPSDLVRHMRVHTREKPYVCKFCNRSFAVKSTLTSHFRTHTKCTKVQCKYCYKFFCSWTSLNAHILRHTCLKHKCSVCNKSFRSSGKLSQHFQTHVNNNSSSKGPNSNALQPIKITKQGLQPAVSLRKKPLTEAGCRNRPYMCKVCGAGFKRLGHLKQHQTKHTGERPYRCHLCYRNFTSNGILKTHMQTHNGVKPYKCVICQKHFSTNGSLKRHLESHSGAKPFLCPYCFKDFKNLLQCKKHMQTHNLQLNLQIETKEELANTELLNKENDIPYTTNLTVALSNDPFALMPSLETQNLQENEKELRINGIQTPPIVATTQTIQADETGTAILPDIDNQENLTQENIQEIEDTLNTQMLNIIGNENFDSSPYINKINVSEPIPSTDELVNTLSGNTDTEKSIEHNQFLYHQVIVNLNPEPEQIPIFDNNGIDNILSQVKLQNDSLFLTDLNTLNINNINVNETNNVLLPFEITQQQDLSQNQLIMLPPEIEPDLQNNTLNTSISLENIDQNLHLKLNGLLNTTQSVSDTDIIVNNHDHVNDSLSVMNVDITAKTIENNIVSNAIATDNQIAAVIPADVITKKSSIICNLCELQFESKNDLKIHQCVNFINVKVNRNVESDSNEVIKIKEPISQKVTKKVFENLVTQKEKEPLSVKKLTPVYKNSCTYCPKTFRKPSDLQRHLRTHTGERPFKCDECAKSFSLKSTLESHSKIHQGRKEFTCHVCNCFFATKGSLSVHMRLHTGVKPYKCPLCQLKFRTSGHRKAHLTVHYKEALRTGKIISDVVTRKTKMSELMEGVQNMIEEHMAENNKNEDNEMPLEDFAATPALQTSHSTVNNIVLQTDEKPLMHFEIETNSHGQIINIKPTATNLLFVEDSKEQVISTQVNFDQKTKSQIENFLRDKKAKQQEVKNRIKKVCTVCYKEFGTKYLLDRHSKIHTGERIFSCNYCTKTFNQKNALQAHVRTHFGTRPYCCPYCSNTFSQSGNLKTHIKRIHSSIQNKETTNSSLITSDILKTENVGR